MVLDYSKFDNIVDSDDEETAPPAAPAPPTYTAEERARLLAEAEAAAARASADTDPRSEIEKLKAERRAKRAAAGPQEPAAPAPVQAPEPEVQPEAEPVDDSPLARLDRAEKDAEAVATEASSVLAALKEGDKDDACKRAGGLAGKLGKLQNAMEEISIGSLDDEAREAAKSRRKAVNKRIEDELMPACAACRVAAAKAKSSA
mmetsp:Transcript_66819/g.139253  ORF Transcript_66819/g.139253 Transcript_66819/m.139253 type:complete len:203 (+) Transcript_66819:61-669(+)|eukprot:CAMPEP_0181343526 /NCGR_PEP_ID=MMETSP1101-20121128/31634_1 /TAXON_ID=46948 /ORGANISM="Rhodomonas abbreviata, Strain Caron Lab Isolate" /LENGTH=202 /DNA_ID=CAMNT_0023455163 /DNA_START=60 /DNA_END=668 /DNA_ORIENTATION=+